MDCSLYVDDFFYKLPNQEPCEQMSANFNKLWMKLKDGQQKVPSDFMTGSKYVRFCRLQKYPNGPFGLFLSGIINRRILSFHPYIKGLGLGGGRGKMLWN